MLHARISRGKMKNIPTKKINVFAYTYFSYPYYSRQNNLRHLLVVFNKATAIVSNP